MSQALVRLPEPQRPVLTYPRSKDVVRGPGYWGRGRNWVRSRHSFRFDRSNESRRGLEASVNPSDRTVTLASRVAGDTTQRTRILILGDSGEGDASQYSLLPVIRELRPNLMIINGDVAYPAGELRDFDEGFFRPYRGLRIPIFATPGNHDYYADQHARVFHTLFCTSALDRRWDEAELIPPRQPGMYWELLEDLANPVSLIGLDTGQEGYLDRDRPWYRGPVTGDDEPQLVWLDTRLGALDRLNARAIVLFHIPALVNESIAKAPALRRLHRMLCSHVCVKAIISAHIHSLQYYAPATFGAFLKDYVAPSVPTQVPHYVVAGASGAYLSSVNYRGEYGQGATPRWPTAAFAQNILFWADRWLQKLPIARGVLAQVAARVGNGAGPDSDAMAGTSLLCLDINADRTVTLTPYLLPWLEALYDPQYAN